MDSDTKFMAIVATIAVAVIGLFITLDLQPVAYTNCTEGIITEKARGTTDMQITIDYGKNGIEHLAIDSTQQFNNLTIGETVTVCDIRGKYIADPKPRAIKDQ